MLAKGMVFFLSAFGGAALFKKGSTLEGTTRPSWRGLSLPEDCLVLPKVVLVQADESLGWCRLSYLRSRLSFFVVRHAGSAHDPKSWKSLI